MIKLFLLPLFVIAFLSARSQSSVLHQISGIALDSASLKPLNNATIELSKEGKKLYTALTNDSGYFVLQQVAAGNYTLTLSCIGYHSKVLSLNLEAEKQVQGLGTLYLIPEGKQLSDVTVTAQKALVEDKGDRLVYNAEKDISNAGGTAADVLRKVPNLSVDLNGNVQMRGNSNIKVLVNGKPSAMMARNLADALRQMPAQAIKTVEVITSPGAKYDAEGAAGVINIITKKGLQGFNGSVNATAGNMNRSLGTSLSVRKKKVGINFSGTGYQNRNINESSSTRTTLNNGTLLNKLFRSSNADNTGTGGYGELSFDYDPDSSMHLNFSANVWGGNYPSNSTVWNRLTDPFGTTLQSFRNESRFKNPYGNGQLDLGYTKTFKKADQEFSLLTQFSRMPDNYFYFTDRYELEDIVYREKSTNYSRNKEYTVQADYTHPFEIKGHRDTTTIKLEVGTKAIIRDIGSEFNVEQSLDGKEQLTLDPARSNAFDYKQRVFSGYTSLRLSNKRKWSLNAGARLEHTEIEGSFFSTETKLRNQYNNLIPNVNISKTLDKHTIKASYTQRITRPLIWYLNPWLNQSDPKNITTGNPNLRPELNHMAEVGHNYSKANGAFSVNSALFLRSTNNAIEYLSRVDSSGVSLSRPENIASRKVYGLNLNITSKPNKNWDLNGGGAIQYIDVRSAALQQSNNGFVWYGNMNSTYRLRKEFSLQLYSSVNSGWLSLQRTTKTLFYWNGFSAKKQFWDKKASLNLSLNNPFKRGIEQRSIEQAPSFISESSFLFVNRSVRLTFEWRFGQMSAGGGKQGKKIKNEDSGR